MRWGQTPSLGWVIRSNREYFEQDEDGIVEDLRRNWLGRGWINISDALADEVVGQMWEIFANAFEHSDTRVGVYSCGQYFKARRVLTLAVADFGVGIPSNVTSSGVGPELYLPRKPCAGHFSGGRQRAVALTDRAALAWICSRNLCVQTTVVC